MSDLFAQVLKETKAKELEWGEASSPLIVGDTIYIQGGIGEGAPVAIAVNKSSGKITWQSDAKGSATGKNSMPNGTGGGYAGGRLLGVAVAQVGVDVYIPDAKGPAYPDGRKIACLDESVDRHGRHPHQLCDFLHRQKARCRERLRHAA